MSGLPREVIKWVQSLNLQSRLKDPRRDLANGYIIAEIFSRYYPSDLSVDRFYTGHSSAHKDDNWKQLMKFFKKHNYKIPVAAIQAVATCQPDAALVFLCNIYTLLTDRKVTIVCFEKEPVPHHQIPTANDLLRRIDNREKAIAILQTHAEYLAQIREQRRQNKTAETISQKGDMKANVVTAVDEEKRRAIWA